MGKKSKSKPFIDKKHASSYTLMHRTQAELALLPEVAGGSVAASTMVLWPNNNYSDQDKDKGTYNDNSYDMHNKNKNSESSESGKVSSLSDWKRKLQQAHLVLDEEEASDRYLKEFSGTGVFVNARGQILASSSAAAATTAAATTTSRAPAVTAEDNDDNGNTDTDTAAPLLLFDNVNLTTDFMDEDMAAALFGGDDLEELDGLEELDDDFCFQAAQEPVVIDNQEFDYDAHIQQLLEKARRERQTNSGEHEQDHAGFQNDQDFFRQLKPLKEDDNEDIDDDDGEYELDSQNNDLWNVAPGVVPKLSPDEERALCEKFEATLAEYDDSDSDSNDDHHHDQDDHDNDNERDDPNKAAPSLFGPRRELEGDRELEAALDDFLMEKQDEILMQGSSTRTKTKKQGGSSYAALVGTQMVPASRLNAPEAEGEEENVVADAQQQLADAKEILALPIQAPPPEEIVILEKEETASKSYLAERVRNPWDCESILSTYSNLDNNPIVIEHRQRRQRKHSTKQVAPQQQQQQPQYKKIELSNKTGLPILQQSQNDASSSCGGIQQHEASTTASAMNRGEARNKSETAEQKRARKAAAKQERQLARLQKKATRDVFEQEYQKRQAVMSSDTIGGSTVFRFS